MLAKLGLDKAERNRAPLGGGPLKMVEKGDSGAAGAPQQTNGPAKFAGQHQQQAHLGQPDDCSPAANDDAGPEPNVLRHKLKNIVIGLLAKKKGKCQASARLWLRAAVWPRREQVGRCVFISRLGGGGLVCWR